jgi:hypothetical protein
VVVDQDKWSLSVSTTPSIAVELTQSAVTTTEREVWFQDLPLTATYQRSLYAQDGFSTGANLTGGFIFPTSKPTIAEGTYLYTTLAAGLTQGFPLLDAAMDDAPLLNELSLGGNLRWDHRFGKADVPVDGNLDRPRQNAVGVGVPSDVLSFGGIAHDTLREAINLQISQTPGGMPLGVGVGWIFSQRFIPDFNDNSTCDVQLQTGCVDAEGGDNFTQQAYGFTAGIDFMPVPEIGFSLAYFNVNHELRPDGTRRSPFYSPLAQFNATLTFNIDAAYERITGPARKIAQGEKTRGAL